jgi:hypothetical protein
MGWCDSPWWQIWRILWNCNWHWKTSAILPTTDPTWITLGLDPGLLTPWAMVLPIIKSMNYSTIWEGNSCSDIQEIPCLLQALRFHYIVRKTMSLVPVLSYMNPVHMLQHISFILSRDFSDSRRGFDWRPDILNTLIQRVATLYISLLHTHTHTHTHNSVHSHVIIAIAW